MYPYKAVAGAGGRDNKMWVEKYRPNRLEDVAAHKEIIDTIGGGRRRCKLGPGLKSTTTRFSNFDSVKRMYNSAFNSNPCLF